jgi:ribose transport system substrate-binding protein
MKQLGKTRALVAIGAIALIATACSSGGGATTTPASQAPAASAPAAESPSGSATASQSATSLSAGSYKIGYSNGGGVGNGFREEQVCTAKAQWAAYGGKPEDLVVKHRNTDAAGQASDIRDLIAAGVDAIVFNPNDPEALNGALQEAKAQGIKTVSVDAFVTDPDTWNLYNNQVKYAELGAKWLFDQLGGSGTVWYTRGLAGHPADSDRDIGFNNVLKEYPNIKVVPEGGVATGWDPAKATQITNDFISSGQYDQVDGIWASGMGKQIIDAIKGANKPYKPIADADVGGFVAQLLDPTGFPDLKGAAVTNTAAVGGAGITMGLKLLSGETVTPTEGASQPNTVLLDPVLVDNLTPEGQQQLKDWVSVPNMDPLWPLSLSIDGWTTYDPNTVPASCSGA